MSKQIIISDLDGTIANVEHRLHWLKEELHPELSSHERWRRFFAYCVNDTPNKPIITILDALWRDGHEIHIFSGRSDEVRTETEEWLRANGVWFYSKLLMRPAGDFTPDEETKRDWLKEYDKANILCVFDDRQKVVDMWREEGLTCFQVAPGDF